MGKLSNLLLAALLVIGVGGCENKTDQNMSEQEQAGETVSTGCDRNCLEGFVNQYLDAMVAHDTSRAPFGDNARYTENADEVSLSNISEGLWTSAIGLTDYKFYVADPEAGQIAFVGFIRTKGQEEKDGKTSEVEKPVLLSMRLKVENKHITEAEAIVVDSMMGGAMTVPPAAYSEALAPEERLSREELVKISNLYFDSIELCNGSIVQWHDEC